ncbi:MAG TPA: amidohydrolase family protein [Thermoanaerobaculia bacterium]|nr:amidohydrolase family protein [Thermoanaerobaculia bacterium]
MRIATAFLVLLLAFREAPAAEREDLAAARSLFEENIAAIRERDRAKYLSLYLDDARLIRTGPSGFSTGFEDFAAQAGEGWPDMLEANDMRLTPVQPGVVYGTYRYRVRYGAEEHAGISERLFVRTAAGWKIALTGAIDTPPGTPPPPRAIAGGTLIDGRGGPPVKNATVIVRNGRIDCAGRCEVPPGIDVLDARGMWITPGLIDAHVHFSQTGWADGRPDALDVRATHPYENVQAELEAKPERFGRSYLCSGVTTVFDVGGYPWTLRLEERLAHDTTVPRVVAAGPLLSTRDHWVNLPAERQFIHLKDETAARDGVRYLAAQGTRAVKVWYLEENGIALAAAAEEARKHGLPLIVHATELAKAKDAVRAGAALLVHGIWDQPVDQEFLDLARRAGTIVTPTMTVVGGYSRMYRSILDRIAPAVDDPNRCVDRATLARVASTASLPAGRLTSDQLARREQANAEEQRIAAANLQALVAAGIPIATGTDAGNPLTLHGPAIYAEMEAMQRAGMTPSQVIVASTSVAARAAGVAGETGTIEPGRAADLLIVAGDPAADVANFRKLRYVVRAGVTRSVRDLSALASAE